MISEDTDNIAMLVEIVREEFVHPHSARRRVAASKLMQLGFVKLHDKAVGTFVPTEAGVAFLRSCSEILDEFLVDMGRKERPPLLEHGRGVWHLTVASGKVWCTADYPNMRSTTVVGHVTCRPCLRLAKKSGGR